MKFCPNCGTDLAQYGHAGQAVAAAYNQTAIWRALVAKANEVKASPPAPEALVMPAVDRLRSFCASGQPAKTVVHVVFDRSVVPSGGLLHQITAVDGRTNLDAHRLEAMGYVVSNGKVSLVDDVPIGPIYSTISYWGGDRQHKRWHLTEPCTLDPSRNGDPFFMDENMVAFGATWRDAERSVEALLELLGMFTNGFGADRRVIGVPLALELAKH